MDVAPLERVLGEDQLLAAADRRHNFWISREPPVDQLHRPARLAERPLVSGRGVEDGLDGIDIDADCLGPALGELPKLSDAAVTEVGHALRPQRAEAGPTEPLER